MILKKKIEEGLFFKCGNIQKASSINSLYKIFIYILHYNKNDVNTFY